MKFDDFKYHRPDMDTVKAEFVKHTQDIRQAQTAQEGLAAIRAVQTLQSDLDTNATLTSIRYSVDTRDAFYTEENDFWDEQSPVIGEWVTDYYRAVLDSPFIEDFKKELPHTFFQLAENQLKIFSPEIIPLLQKENRLVSEYSKLKASAEIEYKGEIYNLSSIGAFTQDKDRQVRKESSELITQWYGERIDEFDRIYDEMVKTRHEIAMKLGFKDFVEVGYARMARLDYDRKDVEVYREEVRKHVVPLAQKLIDRQAQRLGLDEMAYYDLGLTFPNGNAVPTGSSEEILEAAVQMYHELSPETAEFIDLMIQHDCLDLEAKPGKNSGAYCTYLPNFKTPYIFANFNGTSADVEVMTHEAGHAFQVFNSRWIDTPEAVWPTLESCEIHSMSMEFLTWPWMKNFFGDQIEKFKYQHLAGAVLFIPYGVLVDHFQHEVYEHPEMTPAERRQRWRELEKMYNPWKNYQANDFYEAGGWWFKQLHIFVQPFYYIDYTLAQVCAFQFWKRSQVDHDPKAWEDYLNICKVGGTQSFTEIIETGHLQSPFGEGNLAETLKSIEQYLDQVDEATLRA